MNENELKTVWWEKSKAILFPEIHARSFIRWFHSHFIPIYTHNIRTRRVRGRVKLKLDFNRMDGECGYQFQMTRRLFYVFSVALGGEKTLMHVHHPASDFFLWCKNLRARSNSHTDLWCDLNECPCSGLRESTHKRPGLAVENHEKWKMLLSSALYHDYRYLTCDNGKKEATTNQPRRGETFYFYFFLSFCLMFSFITLLSCYCCAYIY